jgi:hypothetical protein
MRSGVSPASILQHIILQVSNVTNVITWVTQIRVWLCRALGHKWGCWNYQCFFVIHFDDQTMNAIIVYTFQLPMEDKRHYRSPSLQATSLQTTDDRRQNLQLCCLILKKWCRHFMEKTMGPTSKIQIRWEIKCHPKAFIDFILLNVSW